MTGPLTRLISALTIVVLVVTAGAAAAARGQARAASGEMVLCTGSGPVSVPVDSRGRPLGPPHLCPDCALALFAAAPEAPAGATPADMPARRLSRAVGARARAGRVVGAARARGPPGA